MAAPTTPKHVFAKLREVAADDGGGSWLPRRSERQRTGPYARPVYHSDEEADDPEGEDHAGTEGNDPSRPTTGGGPFRSSLVLDSGHTLTPRLLQRRRSTASHQFAEVWVPRPPEPPSTAESCWSRTWRRTRAVCGCCAAVCGWTREVLMFFIVLGIALLAAFNFAKTWLAMIYVLQLMGVQVPSTVFDWVGPYVRLLASNVWANLVAGVFAGLFSLKSFFSWA